MADYFVDSTTGSNADNGTTMDLAWATIEYALESGGLSAGDNIWTRRLHSEIPLTDILPIYDGTADNPISTIAWPRAAIPNTTITEADWTNGNPLVDNVVGITPSRTKHTARYCIAPDGKKYTINAVIWEAGVDGMAAGAEFAVGDILTNITQTKKGKVWGFTDNLDTTGTIQYVRDSSTAWIENDNITSDGGGDAEIDVGGETAVGFLIDREYSGATVTGVNGLFQIEADDDYALAQAIDDTGWTINKASYNADAHDLAVVDFNDGAFQLYVSGDFYHVFKNIEFKDSADTNGIVYSLRNVATSFIGCLFKQTTQNTVLCKTLGSFVYFKRVIMEGSGNGVNQRGLSIVNGAKVNFIDGAIYNCGSSGLQVEALMFFNNLNVGVEIANGDEDIRSNNVSKMYGRDLSLGGTNGYVFRSFISKSVVNIENYQKILGNHKTWFLGGEYTNVDVGDTDAPSVADATGKTTDLMELLPNVSGFEFIEDWAVDVFQGEEDAVNGARTYTLYLQNNMGVTLNVLAKDDIWLKAEYVSQHDDDSEYVVEEAFSTETSIAQRADDTDWDSLSVTVNAAVASKVRLTLYISKYVASGGIYIGGVATS